MNSIQSLNAANEAAKVHAAASSRAETIARADAAALAQAEDRYVSNPDASTAEAVDLARERAERSAYRARLIERSGGPEGARLRFLNTPENLRHFAAVFGERETTIAERLKIARRELAAGVAELVADGMNASLAPLHPSLTPARERVARLEGAAQAAFQDRSYAERGRWEDRSFDELFAAASAPIPN